MIDQSKFDVLRAELAAKERALRELLAGAARAKSKVRSLAKPRTAGKAKTLSIPESYELVVTSRDEKDQRQLYERLSDEGYDSRVLTM